MVFDPYSSLAPSSRGTAGASAGPGGAGRNRLRLGVGAAVVLLLIALGAAVAVTAIGQVGHSIDVAANPGSGSHPGEAGPAITGAGSGEDPAAAGSPVPGSSASSSAASSTAGDAAGIFVHVLGAVARPGLFEVRAGARVVDVVAAAGGLLPEADQAGVNLARPVTDGEQLYVPQQGEVVAAPGPPGAGAGGVGGAGETGDGPAGAGAGVKVNLNTATAADLDTLPRIGPAMAQRILDYRAAEGRFTSIDDLRNVTGIGEKTFAALKDLVAV
jgi:competence protein ComEA